MSRLKDGTEIKRAPSYNEACIIMDDILAEYAAFCARYPGGLRQLVQPSDLSIGFLRRDGAEVSDPNVPVRHGQDEAPGRRD